MFKKLIKKKYLNVVILSNNIRTMQKNINIILALDNDNTLGIFQYDEYELPWPLLQKDTIFFKKVTTDTGNNNQQNACIMGSNTWKSLPDSYKADKKRFNIVLSSSSCNSGTYPYVIAENFDKAVEMANNLDNIHEIFILGGVKVYSEALRSKYLKRIYFTRVETSYPNYSDVEKIYFDTDIDKMVKVMQDKNIIYNTQSNTYRQINRNINYIIYQYDLDYTVCEFSEIINIINSCKFNLGKNKSLDFDYENDQNDENQYMQLIKHIMNNGIEKIARNDTTLSVLGCQLRFDLRKGYPLLTVKKSYPKAIFEELMWFIRGDTNVKHLQEKGIKIWNGNSSKQYLEKYGLPYEEGDIGPGYGFQMRHCGAKYIDCNTDYTGQGVDQLENCIHLIKTDPGNRRIMIDLWNVPDISIMALPPCHVLYHFTVDIIYDDKAGCNRSFLNCHLFQRSWDVLLGWNTTTAALLTYILAKHCDLEPGTLIHSVTDIHFYNTHMKSGAIDKLLTRKPRMTPKLTVVRKRDNIEDYQFSDLVLENYHPAPAIIAEMIA